jgi:broad specificity phosphatase PhoE
VESPVLVRLWCLRHAESENVTAGVAGAVPAAALTAAGRTQAAAAARELAPVAVAYASTALRARETAAHLSRTVVTVPELVEVGIGALEGATGPAVFAEWAAVLRTWLVDEDLSRRLADGESGHEVVARVGVAFARIAAAHPGETVAVVGHVASLTVGLARLCGLGAQVWGSPLAHARPFLVEWNGRTWHCPNWPAT